MTSAPHVVSEEQRRAIESIVDCDAVSSEVVWDRPHVVRVALSNGGSVIAKRPRLAEGNEPATARKAWETERAALQLLSTVASSPAPSFIGYDADAMVLVMEDLPPGRALADLLLGSDAEAAQAGLNAYAEALARLHVGTVGRENEYDLVRRTEADADADADADAVPGRSEPPWVTLTSRGISEFVGLPAMLGTSVDPRLDDECREVVHDVTADGWWRTFVHGDPCPDNTRIEEGPHGRFRIFDFEWSSYGSALLDASYLVAPFPTCWCFGRIPPSISDAALTAYRTVFGEVAPAAVDDTEWDNALVAALATWVISRGPAVATLLDSDRKWGTTTVRVRFLRWLEALATAADRCDRFPAIRLTSATLLEALTRAWPDATLGDYPALPTGAPTTIAVPDWWRPGL